MRAFVTGGSGFLGRALISELHRQGAEVVALARSPEAAAAVRAAGASPVTGDLLDAEVLRAGMGGCDTVFHAAARVAHWGPDEEYELVNVLGTHAVLEAARQAGVRRLVHVSTEAVLMGDRPLVMADETWPYPQRALSAYCRTKRHSERAVIAADSGELETVVVRLPLLWGAGDTSLLPRFVAVAREGRLVWVAGGRFPYSTCHVRNAAHGLCLAAAQGRAGGVYFLSDGEPVSFREFLTAMLATQGVTVSAGEIPRWLALPLGHLIEAGYRLSGSTAMPPLTPFLVRLFGEEVTISDALARRDLGYAPPVTIEAGLAELAESRTLADAR